MDDHVHRHQNMGQWVLINAAWYKQLPDLDHRILLEPLDEQHAIDRLDGALIQLDADLDAIHGAAA